MTVWIWGTIFLLTGFGLSIYIKSEIIINMREDGLFQGLNLKIRSCFYKINNQYDYTDPGLRLWESILIAGLFKGPNHLNTPNEAPLGYYEYLSFLKGSPLKDWDSLSSKLKILALVLRFAIVERLEWKSTVGSRDALHTALAAGAGWALQGVIIGMLSNKCRLQRVEMDVRPDFTNPAFFSRLSCILKLRMVHIMIIELYVLVLKVRWWINGIRAGTVQPSH